MLGIKRLIDIGGAVLLIVLLSPVLLLVALGVRVKMGSPVLFCQPRTGLQGRTFHMYKFRSMKNAVDASGNPLPDEQRLSRFGLKLRATSLDELPELWNILIGDMSFIGPRPLLPDYLPYYTKEEGRRHDMRPGLTGLAQVNGRNDTSWDDRLRHDVDYVSHWSLGLDFKIALATVGVVLSRRGVSARGAQTMPRLDDYRGKINAHS